MKSKTKKISQLSAGVIFTLVIIWGISYSCEKENIVPNNMIEERSLEAGKTEFHEVIKIVANIGQIGNRTDPFKIHSARMSGNFLYLEIEYRGGCANHTFKLIGSENIQKSLPPIRAIELIHDANGDQCKSILKNTLIIDVRRLAYQQEKGSEIIFTLEGWKDRIHYVYADE